ncbi:MAG: hypothetical protein ACTHNQ_15340 [Microbacterium sp.]|uniref:hypothetical protein n=1 Tax=Microbacterium sp. TaxID=51671 RepID=UPI003F7D8A90
MAMFSFTPSIVDGARRPQQILVDAVRGGAASGVGLDGFQHFVTFPDVSDEEAVAFRADVERLGIFVTELGLYDDVFVQPGRRATIAERAGHLERQIRSAVKLGFARVKLGWGTDFELLDQLAPCLRSTGVTLLEEAQGPLRAGTDDYERRLAYAAAHADHFGFVFDLSASMADLPVTFIEELHRLALPPEVIRLLADEWAEDRSGSLRDRVTAITSSLDLGADERLRLMTPFTRFGNATVSDFRDLFAHLGGVHVKFWDLSDDDGRVSRPIADLARELDRVGYQGSITSEWGGHAWLDSLTHDSLRMVRAHRALYLKTVDRG